MAKRAAGKASRKFATKRKSVAPNKVSAKKRPAKKTAKTAVNRAKPVKTRAATTKKTAKKIVKQSPAIRKTAAKKTAAKKKVETKRTPFTAKAATKPSAVRSRSTSTKATVPARSSKRAGDRKSIHQPTNTRKQASRSRSKVTPPSATPKETPVTQPTLQEADNHPGMMGDGSQEQNLNQAGNSEGRITQGDVDTAFRERDKEA